MKANAWNKARCLEVHRKLERFTLEVFAQVEECEELAALWARLWLERDQSDEMLKLVHEECKKARIDLTAKLKIMRSIEEALS